MPSVELAPRLPVIPVRGLVNDGTRDKLVAGTVTKEDAQCWWDVSGPGRCGVR
jgi:enoyl-[acyl-carrier protein] reductase II